MARELFHHKRRLQRPKLMHPKRDWLIGLLVGIIIIMIMIGWSAYTYLDKRSVIGDTTSDVQAEVPLYRADVVADALEIFAARRDMFIQLEQSGSPTSVTLEGSEVQNVSTTTSSTTDEVVEDMVTEEGGTIRATTSQSAEFDTPIPATSTAPAFDQDETPALMN